MFGPLFHNNSTEALASGSLRKTVNAEMLKVIESIHDQSFLGKCSKRVYENFKLNHLNYETLYIDGFLANPNLQNQVEIL